MVLAHGQVRINDLIMGRGTAYTVRGFNPWSRPVRADRTGTAPWGDGGWSGSEFRDSVSVPMTIIINGSTPSDWVAKHDALASAFDAIRTSAAEHELEWNLDGRERLMFGRARGLSVDPQRVGVGVSVSTAQFVALDGAMYSAAEFTSTVGVLRRTGGLSTPFSVPFGVSSVVADGVATLANAGTSPARLLLRIVGPVSAPRVTVIGPGGIPLTLFLSTVLGANDFLDIDTAERLVLLNGTTSRLSDAFGDWPLLAPGVSTIEFRADAVTAGTLTIRFRDTY